MFDILMCENVLDMCFMDTVEERNIDETQNSE